MNRHDLKYTNTIINCLKCFCFLLFLAAMLYSCKTSGVDTEISFKYEQLPALPDNIGYSGLFVGVVQDRLVIVGGTHFPNKSVFEGGEKAWSDHVLVLKDEHQSWQIAGKIPKPLACGVSVTTSQGLVCVGGVDDQNKYSNQVFIIRAIQPNIRIEYLPALPHPLAYASGAMTDSVIYVAGGFDHPKAQQPLRSFYALDLKTRPDNRKWLELEPWPGQPVSHAISAGVNRSFYLFGGRTNIRTDDTYERLYLKNAFRYYPDQGWTALADLPMNASNAPSPTIHVQDKVFIFGGVRGKLTSQEAMALEHNHPGWGDEIMVYAIDRDVWTIAGQLPKINGKDPINSPETCLWPAINTVPVWWQDRIVIPSGEIRPGTRTPKILSVKIK